MNVPSMAEMMAAGETPDILFWVGCAGSFDARAQKITKAFATILNKVVMSAAAYPALSPKVPTTRYTIVG